MRAAERGIIQETLKLTPRVATPVACTRSALIFNANNYPLKTTPLASHVLKESILAGDNRGSRGGLCHQVEFPQADFCAL
jgi:hypothetical protein